MLSMVKMSLKGEVGSHALNSHGNYIVDHGKIMELCFSNFCGNPVKSTISLTVFLSTNFPQHLFYLRNKKMIFNYMHLLDICTKILWACSFIV